MVSANVSQLRYTEVFTTEKQGLAPPVLAVEVQGLAKVELRIEVGPVELRKPNRSCCFTKTQRRFESVHQQKERLNITELDP